MLAEGYLKANQILCPCAHRDGDFSFVAGAAGSRLGLHSCYSNITANAACKGMIVNILVFTDSY